MVRSMESRVALLVLSSLRTVGVFPRFFEKVHGGYEKPRLAGKRRRGVELARRTRL